MMGDSVSRERTIETRTIDDVKVDIVELAWKYGGVCYDVYAHDGDKPDEVFCISEESFNYVPDDDEIRDLLASYTPTDEELRYLLDNGKEK